MLQMLLFSVRTEALCRNAVYKHNVQAFHNRHLLWRNAERNLCNSLVALFIQGDHFIAFLNLPDRFFTLRGGHQTLAGETMSGRFKCFKEVLPPFFVLGIFYFSACDVFEHIVRKNAKGGLPNGVIY